nr:zinc finger, CCHC-type [Tanacetum cinerariifolium]
MVKRMASMNTRLNTEKLDENIVQKNGGSKQVGFKQLGPGIETGVHGVNDEKRVWFEVELQGAQGDREAKVFQEKEYQSGWKIKTGNVLDSCNQRSTQQCMKSVVAKHLGVAGIQQQNGLVDEKTSTYLVNRSLSSAIGFKKPIDMLGFFGWLASIKQVLPGFNFEVEPLGDHTFEIEPQENIDQGAGLQEVQTQYLIDYQLARDREQHLACELFGYREDSNEAAFAVAVVEKIYAHESLTFNNTVSCKVISKWKAGLKDDMDARSDVYVLSNSCKKCSDPNDGYYWEYTSGINENVLGMEIVRDQSGNTLRVSQFRFYNGKLVQTLLEGHSILSLEGSLSGTVMWKRMIAVQVFVDFDYAIGKSITVKESKYELSLVAGIAIGALVKAVPCPRFQHKSRLLRI